jgi:hypothetical protein
MEQFLSNEESQAASRFLMALERLLAFASENDTQLGTDELEFLIARVKAARTGFPLLQEERPAQQVDRLGSVLLGPVYTSKAHPWPLDSEGCPMAPLCQLNTAQFPVQMDGVEGLVQVWLASTGGAHGDSLIRVIPAAEVDAAEMTPVMAHDGNIEVLVPDAAAWIQDMHAEAKPSRKHFLDERAANWTGTPPFFVLNPSKPLRSQLELLLNVALCQPLRATRDPPVAEKGAHAALPNWPWAKPRPPTT